MTCTSSSAAADATLPLHVTDRCAASSCTVICRSYEPWGGPVQFCMWRSMPSGQRSTAPYCSPVQQWAYTAERASVFSSTRARPTRARGL